MRNLRKTILLIAAFNIGWGFDAWTNTWPSDRNKESCSTHSDIVAGYHITNADLWQAAFEKKLAQASYLDAARFAESCPSEEIGCEAVRIAIGTWYRLEQAKALQWLSQCSNTRNKDLGYLGAGSVMASISPDKAIAFVIRIKDRRPRMKMIHEIALNWKVLDESALERWLETLHELSPVQRAELLGR